MARGNIMPSKVLRCALRSTRNSGRSRGLLCPPPRPPLPSCNAATIASDPNPALHQRHFWQWRLLKPEVQLSQHFPFSTNSVSNGGLNLQPLQNIGMQIEKTSEVEDFRYSARQLFEEMRDSCGVEHHGKELKDKYSELFLRFTKSEWVRDEAVANYIQPTLFGPAAKEFSKFMVFKAKRETLERIVSLEQAEAERFLLQIFAEYFSWKFSEEMAQYRGMLGSAADLSRPHKWYPFARAMKRKIVYHCGPTNSGKTHNALQRFMEAASGLYCGPLRLLAMEVFDRVNAQGVYCSLVTGQERKDVPFAHHVSCTIEMASVDSTYEVAVIDEIQMIADATRGFAWTRAFLGLRADEIHICGDPSVRHLIRNMCEDTGDEMEEIHYPRFKPLIVEAKTLLGNYANIRAGDCVVAFSRREIFEIKLAIEKYTKHKCSIVYGALPPETRKGQANLFNNPDTKYDVLVASDAIGMGLNLSIGRVVFYSFQKYDGTKVQRVSPSQVKQIAGRAGRRGTIYPEGLTTTFQQEDLDYLIQCLKHPFDSHTKAGLFPCFEQFEAFSKQCENGGGVSGISFPRQLERFSECCILERQYFLSQHDHIKRVAYMLEKVPGLSLEERYNFCFAPVNIRDPRIMHYLRKFAQGYAIKSPVNIGLVMPKRSARNDEELLDLETRHQVVSLYLWLSHQFRGQCFPFTDKAESMALCISELLGQSLAKAHWKPTSKMASEHKRAQQKGTATVARHLKTLKPVAF